ncbi:MAG: uL15 family ribosomal protein [Patescibacteria group bacterium]
MVLINEIQPKNKLKKKKRIGRGGKRGTYSGKGMKGQKARAGAKIKSEKKEAILRIPKKRGIRFVNRPSKTRAAEFGVNLSEINKTFNQGEIVNLKTLVQRGLVKKQTRVKILAKGGLNKKLSFSGLFYSKTAKQLIEKAGGTAD